MPTARDTVHGMNLGTGLVAFAAVQAMQAGIERGQQLRAADRAHEIGRKRYVARVRQRIAEQDAEAEAAAARLMRNRKRLHG